MDLDGDGNQDILSGSWPGELYFFKGKGKGRFAEPVILNGKDKKPINIDKASTVFAFDWRGTGRLDLLVGGIKGHVYLVPDVAKKGPAVWGTPEQLKVGTEVISAPGGDSHPVVADWDNTGLPGLLLGCGDGSVSWYANVGKAGSPKLAKAVTLVATPAQMDASSPIPKGPIPGQRAKIAAVDWNNDGYLDLLVGDVSMIYGKEPRLSKEQIKLRDETKAQIDEMAKEMLPFWVKMQEKLNKIKDPKKQEAERKKQVAEATRRFKSQMEEQMSLSKTFRELQRPMLIHGHVWVHLRERASRNSRH